MIATILDVATTALAEKKLSATAVDIILDQLPALLHRWFYDVHPPMKQLYPAINSYHDLITRQHLRRPQDVVLAKMVFNAAAYGMGEERLRSLIAADQTISEVGAYSPKVDAMCASVVEIRTDPEYADKRREGAQNGLNHPPGRTWNPPEPR